jgi:hypothetical protein
MRKVPGLQSEESKGPSSNGTITSGTRWVEHIELDAVSFKALVRKPERKKIT